MTLAARLAKLEALATPRRRKVAYRIATAALAVAATYGIVTGEEAAAWLYLAAAVTGMADRNVPQEPAEE